MITDAFIVTELSFDKLLYKKMQHVESLFAGEIKLCNFYFW